VTNADLHWRRRSFQTKTQRPDGKDLKRCGKSWPDKLNIGYLANHTKATPGGDRKNNQRQRQPDENCPILSMRAHRGVIWKGDSIPGALSAR